jgi:hypothetical protein
MSTLGTLRVMRVDVQIPPAGAWYASGLLDSSTLPAVGPTVLTIGDLALTGGVIRADYEDAANGALVSFVARGGPGWARATSRAGVYGGGDVRLSTVLRDLAELAGETYTAPADVTIGAAYRWEASSPLAPVRCSHVLDDLVTRGALPTWRIEPATGRTVFSPWPAIGAADGRGRVAGRGRMRGRRTVGLDVQVAAFLPGATLEGALIRRTVLHETASALVAEVYEQ